MWLDGVMVEAGLLTTGPWFISSPVQCQVTTLGKLFTHLCFCHQAVKHNLVLVKGRRCSVAGKVAAGLVESTGSLPQGL